jgi:hypothetical protein
MFRWLAALALVCACCSKSDVQRPAGDSPRVHDFTIFATAEVRGQIGPCGCTSDPLGDISRTTQLVGDARGKGPVMFLDAGSLLYSQTPIPAHLDAEEQLKADLLADIYQNDLKVDAIGLGPADIAKGPSQLRLPRTECDANAPWTGLPGAIHEIGGAKVGVFGVIAKDAFAVDVSDPVVAGKQAVADLKTRGAQMIVALVQASSKKDAVALVRAIGGVDLSIAGLGLAAPEPDDVEPEPTKIDSGWMVIPANRGQVVSRIDVHVVKGGPMVEIFGADAAAAKVARDDKDLAARDAELATFAADPTADPAFVATKKRERDQLAAERDNLKNHPAQVPTDRSSLSLAQVRINKTLACSVPAQTAVTKFYEAAGKANVTAAALVPPIPVDKGKPTYVGQDACTDCHSDEAKFWQKTVHAQGWQTLVERGQQFDYECIGCHVTGFDKPGGSTLASNDKLRDVQCETCHGPGSIHVAKGGEEKPLAIVKTPADDLCATQCHTHEHSDTFQHDAYLRDITGPGHAEKFRAKLGDGPTGHELRKAALDKAGRTLGAGCIR